jgi:hypothetical protein
MDYVLTEHPSSPIYFHPLTDRQIKSLFFHFGSKNQATVKNVTPIISRLNNVLSYFRQKSTTNNKTQHTQQMEELQALLVNTVKHLPNLSTESFLASVNYLIKQRNKTFEYGITHDCYFYQKLLSRNIIPSDVVSLMELTFIQTIQTNVNKHCLENEILVSYCQNYTHLYIGGTSSNMNQLKLLLKNNNLQLYGATLNGLSDITLYKNSEYNLIKDTHVNQPIYNNEPFTTMNNKCHSVSCFFAMNEIAFPEFYVDLLYDLLHEDGLLFIYDWNVTEQEVTPTFIDIFTIISKCKSKYQRLTDNEKNNEMGTETINNILENHMSFCRSEKDFIEIFTSSDKFVLLTNEENNDYKNICSISIMTFQKKIKNSR